MAWATMGSDNEIGWFFRGGARSKECMGSIPSKWFMACIYAMHKAWMPCT